MAARQRGLAIAMQIVKSVSVHNAPCFRPPLPILLDLHQISAPLTQVTYPSPTKWTHSRSLSCCAGLGTPPPREIIVEYCEAAGYTDYFIKLADGIEDAFPELVVLGNPDGLDPRNGSFEVKTGDTILFSKLKTNRLPMLEDILQTLDALPPHCQEVAQ